MEIVSLDKRCTRCKLVKPLTEFTKSNRTKDKLKPHCRDCERKRVKRWRKKNKEKRKAVMKEYYNNNKEKIYKKSRLWLENNKEKMQEYYKEYRKTHKYEKK